jgi:hypothetical protein
LPVNNPANLTTVKIVTNMNDAAADLQTSLRATMSATEEIFDISFIRSQNTNNVVIIYTYENAP